MIVQHTEDCLEERGLVDVNMATCFLEDVEAEKKEFKRKKNDFKDGGKGKRMKKGEKRYIKWFWETKKRKRRGVEAEKRKRDEEEYAMNPLRTEDGLDQIRNLTPIELEHLADLSQQILSEKVHNNRLVVVQLDQDSIKNIIARKLYFIDPNNDPLLSQTSEIYFFYPCRKKAEHSSNIVKFRPVPSYIRFPTSQTISIYSTAPKGSHRIGKVYQINPYYDLQLDYYPPGPHIASPETSRTRILSIPLLFVDPIDESPIPSCVKQTNFLEEKLLDILFPKHEDESRPFGLLEAILGNENNGKLPMEGIKTHSMTI